MSYSFSIRDFTSKVRTRDVFKCYPFPTGDATADEVRSWLPPMEVKRFRWWSDQFRSNRPHDADAGEPRNPQRVEEAVVSGESEKLPEKEGDEEKLENPPVEEMDSRREDGERESENSPSSSLMKKEEEEEEEKLENPPVEEMDSRREDGERESANLSSSSLTEKEEEKLENPPAEEMDSRREDGERESENLPSSSLTEKEEEAEEEKLENPPVEDKDSRREDGERESEISPSSFSTEKEKEEEKLEMVCPVCRDFNAATLTAVNAHIDGCLREERRQQMSSKSILNEPKKKKRSIAEIFDVEEEEKGQEQEQEENLQEQQRSVIETAAKFSPIGEDVSETVEKFQSLSRRLEALRSNAGDGSIGGESSKSDEGRSNSASEDSLLPSPEEEEEKSEMVCPVCRVFNAATVTAANAHIDSCLEQAMREARWPMRKRLCSNLNPKPQKKRSMREILTVAPQIEAGESHVEDREEGEEEEKDEERVAIKSKKKIVKKVTKKKMAKKVMKKKTKVRIKRRVVLLNKMSRNIKKKTTTTKKIKKKKKNLFNDDALAATKEDAYKSKAQNSVDRSRKLKGNGNKTVKFDNIDAADTNEKRMDSKIFSEEKREQMKNCDSAGKQQEAVSPICGILKSHKHVSGSTSSGCSNQEGTEGSHCDVQVPASDRHVKFSGKDCILGPEERNSYDEAAASNLASEVLASSLTKEQSSGSDEATANLEANRNDDNNAISIDKGKEVCAIVESKQFSNDPGHAAVQSFLKPCTNQEKSKHLVQKGESSSKVASCDKFDKGNITPPHFSPYAGISRFLSALQAGQICGVNTQMRESGTSISPRNFIDLEDPSFQSAPMSSNANTRTILKPSSLNSASYNKGNERPGFQLHTYGDQDNNGKALSGRPSSYMLSADKIDNNSLLFHGQGKESVRDNRMDQNFIGLPLNSHGELINFSSSRKVGKNQPDTSGKLRGSFKAPVNDIIHQKTLQDQVNPIPHYPARLGVTESHGKGRADMYQYNSDRHFNQHVQPLDSGLKLVRSPFIEQNQLDKMPPYHKGNGMISPKQSSDLVSPSSSQPTMRLMGKDFPIGETKKEKQQILRGDFWAGEESRRKHYSEDAAADNSALAKVSKLYWASGSLLQTSTENVSQSAKIPSNPSLQSTLLMKGNPGVSRNATSSAAYNRAPSDLQWQLKPQTLSFQSQALPTPQLTSSSQGELNDRKKHHDVTSSAFGFPFMHPVGEAQAKTSLFQNSGGGLPSWLSSGSTHERLPGTSASKSFPQDTLGNRFATPSVNHSADFHQYPPNNSVNSSHCPRKSTALLPASIVQPPHVPAAPSPSIRVTDRFQLNDMATKQHLPCTNTRKRPADNFIDLTRPNKLPNLGQSSSAEFRRNAGAVVELDPPVNGAARGIRRQNEAQNLNPASYLGFDSSNRDGVATSSSGPVKLSHGAKGILRPSQNVDQENTRTINAATMPVSATTDCGRDLELQRRLTKMYRF